ncbi:alpha/beta fold hydrolase [Aurantimonas endophytica]|uniref:Pimeloyl-ACP methyl ester carboxylesterase n=1 Tax=Aurantimonas endophytica TaxID=1522175 RepID=A0A7W6HET9_9HYPH|nr:alpha/beta hydrolase [Aurantimonas endophytica]MBB4003628.1 pimeloyl-ACP methyl ester carboxylesterase [Aurantimonas endophytica]MCO6404486.1 alpha/beta fold hydrolase [Aurantimonas endophytica]
MTDTSRVRVVATSHGPLVVEESGEHGTPLILIHGNSTCRRVFQRQVQSQLSSRFRLITFDLPGHGQSADAADPMRSYTLPGLADAVVELLAKLGITEAVIMGWSLGGHIGIEMIPRFPGMLGLILTGTPPIRPGGFAEGFLNSPHFQSAGRSVLSAADIDVFAGAVFGEPMEGFVLDAMARADGRFRHRLFEASRSGAGIDQRAAVEDTKVPTLVVNGATDPLINLEYVETVPYGNLWSGRCYRIRGVGHAPFWQAPTDYNLLIERFVRDVAHPGWAVAGAASRDYRMQGRQ